MDAVSGKPLGSADVTLLTMPDSFKRTLEFTAMAYGKRLAHHNVEQVLPASTKGSPSAHSAQGVPDHMQPAQLTAWDKMLERPDRTQSKPNGLFYFLDLPDGEYSLQVSMASSGRRYGKLKASAKVSRDAGGNMAWVFVRCALPPTLVKGKVTGSGQEAGIPLARVRVKGSGERAFTDAQGQYVLTGIEPGKKRTLQVSAQGFPEEAQEFTLLEAGASKKVDFKLARENG